MFIYCYKLVGAVAYNENKVNSAMANPTTGYFTSTQDRRGDINDDGEVDAKDVTQLINIILGKEPRTEKSDVNGDGDVNALDVTDLVNIILSN